MVGAHTVFEEELFLACLKLISVAFQDRANASTNCKNQRRRSSTTADTVGVYSSPCRHDSFASSIVMS